MSAANLCDLQAARRVLDIWESECAIVRADSNDPTFGRRIEIDGRWSIYNVFDGTTSFVDREIESGLTSTQSLTRLSDIRRQYGQEPQVETPYQKPSFANWIREHTASCH